MKSKQIIVLFALLKLCIHIIFNNQYGLHRDEFLYFAEGQHLGWGYMEGPPMIAVIAWLASIFGSSEFVLRLMPTFAGVASIVVLGFMVLELGGKKWAVFIACLAFLLSPNYLRSNMLFQPVSFNQFFWLLTMFVVVLLIKRKDYRLWYWLGLVVGLGLMTKYSIVFLLLPLIIGSILLKETRLWYRTKYPYIAFGIATIIVVPNVLWQFNHNFPVLVHMEALSNSQLVHVSIIGFIRDQFLNHLAMSLIWFAGLIFLIFDKSVKPYRLVAFTYLGLILILIALSGKSYYSMGIYSTLFVFGGLATEKFIRSAVGKIVLSGITIVSLMPFLPYALTILPMEKMASYCAYMDEKAGLDAPIIWEDGRKYPIPQDYADMRGWEDMVRRVSKVYHAMSPEEQNMCNIWGGSYGHAGAINFYRHKYDLPEALSASASFLIWCPVENDFTTQIILDDTWQSTSVHFDELTFIDSSQIVLSRDPGYIFVKRKPKVNIAETWNRIITDEKERFNFR